MIWVIGCNGMLGTELCRRLSEKNIEYVGTDRQVDITDFEELNAFYSSLNKNVSHIINCAAYTAVDNAESDEALAEKLNAIGPENIARLADKAGAVMVHISTDYVFDGTGDTPRTEDMPVAPLGVYGKTKAAGEEAVKNNCKKHFILRTAWLYGWAGKNFVYTMLRAMSLRDSVKVVNDQKGSPTFCGDLADVIIALTETSSVEYGIYHVTDSGEITWWDFTNEIKKQGLELGIIENAGCSVNPCTTAEYPTPARRPAYSVLSKEKIQKALGISLPDWKDSLKTFLSSQNFDRTRLK